MSSVNEKVQERWFPINNDEEINEPDEPNGTIEYNVYLDENIQNQIQVPVPVGYKQVKIKLIPNESKVTTIPNNGIMTTQAPNLSVSNVWEHTYTRFGRTSNFDPIYNRSKGGEVMKNKPMSKTFIFSFCMFFISAIFTGAFGLLTILPTPLVDRFSAFIGLLGGLLACSIIFYDGIGKELSSK